MYPPKGFLKIFSTPSDAEAYINDEYKGKTPLVLKLDPGNYSVKVTKDGYEGYETEIVEIETGKIAEINVFLKPYGILKISSDPSDAEVYINGEYRGNTPLELKLDPGNYSVKVTKDGYENYETKIEIKTGKTTEVNAVLKPYGILKIYSTPSGAKVYIDGYYKGTTPLTVEVSPGTHTIKIKKDGYKDYSDTVYVSSGDSKTINAKLTSKKATLYIRSDPSGAKVYIDGYYKGTTPLTVEVSPGTHTIKIKKDGYKDYSDTVYVSSGDSKTINAKLTSKKATLYIRSDPSGAKVYINGEYKGKTPLELKLDPGFYTVKISKDGYEDYIAYIILRSGKTTKINAVLKLYGTLKISSNPSRAYVYINGKYVGITPLELNLSPGSYNVEIKTIFGEKVYEKTVVVKAGEITKISADLNTNTGISSSDENNWNSSNIITALNTKSEKTVKSNTSITALLGNIGIGALLIIGLLLLIILTRSRKPSETSKQPTETSPDTPEKLDEKLQAFPKELLPKYKPLEFLGEGGFAKVFKVKRRSDGKIIALKIPNLDEKARKFFLKEIRAWRLLNHPNIVKLYNAYEEPIPHIEMEYIEGITLNGKVIRDLGKYPKPVDEKKTLDLIRGIAKGLKHAHSKQIYHRDLKPQNILITPDLTPKITDWGLAKIGAISTSATTTKGLTLLYAAPEQLDEETYGHTDHRTDIYQLGLIFYELLTGKLPYEGITPTVVVAKVINPAVKPKPPSYFNKELAKYDGIFEKLLAKRKEDRYQSVDEFLKALDSIEELTREKEKFKDTLTKTTQRLKISTDKKEIEKLTRDLIETTVKLALNCARVNDKVGLLDTLELLRDYVKSEENRKDLEKVISHIEYLIKEGIPIGEDTIERLKVLLNRIKREWS
ncbi:serine/threonine protein kinase [Methanofervidicoccus sp. A16]|uniref:PEGA domain-containing protein n=1 Tax=Methanofervidicoccus sp. A16 TaxID=2607662 RepID=UPI00118B04FC|nr:PEGA domain-containing protein [Methanofervidicoccus sp. A16]AXI24711.1 serine/threonine protein kinase [Methanofervidicoccus sp. A16]